MPVKEPTPCKSYHSPVALPYTYRRKASLFQKLYLESRFFIHFVGKVRRQYLINFRKKYVQRQISQRKGACRKCGTCCNLLITCPMLLKKGRCIVYGLCRPQTCKVFPIDQRDLNEVQFYNRTCGFHFDFGEVGKQKTDKNNRK